MEWFPWLLCPFGCTLSTRQLPWWSGGFSQAGFGSLCPFAAGARLQLNICLSKSAKLLVQPKVNSKVWGIFLVGFLFCFDLIFLEEGSGVFLVGCCFLGFFETEKGKKRRAWAWIFMPITWCPSTNWPFSKPPALLPEPAGGAWRIASISNPICARAHWVGTICAEILIE